MPRLEKHIENEAFLTKILTENELVLYKALNHSRRKLEFLSGRYAAKEAYAKAVGTGIGHVDFLDFEVLYDDLGKPMHPNSLISISHDGDYAIAVVILNG